MITDNEVIHVIVYFLEINEQQTQVPLYIFNHLLEDLSTIIGIK